MFIRKFVKYFSQANTLIIPYNPKGIIQLIEGYNNPPYDEQVHKTITKEFGLEENGFIYAFNNLISSLNQNDFYVFATETCDPLLVEGFKNGMKKLKADGKTVEVVLDQNIKEEILFTKPTLLGEVDQNKSYYSQSYIQKTQVENFPAEIYFPLAVFSAPLLTITFGCYIKCAVSLKIKGLDVYPNKYHFVEFQLIKNPKNQGKQILKFLLWRNNKDFFFGEDYEWRIINIDGFLKKAK